MDDCIFCKIVQKEIPAHIVYEDERTIAFLDAKPNNPGHTLVVPKKHAVNIFDIDERTLCDVWNAVRRVAPAVARAAGTDAVNINTNNGAVAGQLVMHYHVHVIPRHAGDGYELWKGKDTSSEVAAAMAEKIKSALA